MIDQSFVDFAIQGKVLPARKLMDTLVRLQIQSAEDLLPTTTASRSGGEIKRINEEDVEEIVLLLSSSRQQMFREVMNKALLHVKSSGVGVLNPSESTAIVVSEGDEAMI